MVVANKFLSDAVVSYADYALAGEVTPVELKQMEKKLVSLLNFDLFIDEQKFTDYSGQVAAYSAAHGMVLQSCGVQMYFDPQTEEESD